MTSILENISTGVRCTCHHPRIIHKWYNEINQHNFALEILWTDEIHWLCARIYIDKEGKTDFAIEFRL